MNASEPREDAVAVLQRLLASHKDYTQSQQRGWPAHDKGYPNLEWSLEIEHSAEAAIAALAQQGAEPVAWISRDALAALRKCRADTHNGCVGAWMRPTDTQCVPLYTATGAPR